MQPTEDQELLESYTKEMAASRGAAWWRRVRYEVGSVVRCHPRLYLPIARRRRRGEPLTRQTQLVIEGFPRSGNTFCVASFGASQTTPVKLARHEHAPAQVIQALRQGIPALVLVRKPEDAVVSLAIQQPQLTIRQLLRSYVRFYRPLGRHIDQMVVATFEQVITDLGRVIHRVNCRYGTAFDLFDHTDVNARRSLEEIERHSKARWGPGMTSEMKRSAPTQSRERVKEALRAAYREPRLRRPRERAEREYERFAQAAEGSTR